MAKSSRRRVANRSQRSAVTSASASRRGGGDGGGIPGGTTSAPAPGPTPRPGGRGFRPFGWLARLRPRAVGDVIAELRKVTWPTPADTRYLTFVVAVVAIIVGLVLGAFDLAFGWIIEQLFFD